MVENKQYKIKIYTEDEKAKLKELTNVIRDELSILEVASNLYGLTFQKAKQGARYIKCVEHSSMVFDLQKNKAYHNAKVRRTAMSVFDFVAYEDNISFTEARNKIIDYYKNRDPNQVQLFHYNIMKNEVKSTQGLVLPKHNDTNQHVIDYLVESRKINPRLVKELIDGQMLYEDKNENCVFVGFDGKGKAQFGFRRGTKKTIPYKCDCFGSFKQVGWYHEIHPALEKLVLCEAMIDGCSYLSMYDNYDANVLCSSGAGCALITLQYAFDNRPHVLDNCKTLVLALDPDGAGREASKEIIAYMKENHPDIIIESFEYEREGEDLNECLIRHCEENEIRELEISEVDINKNSEMMMGEEGIQC